MNRYKHFTALIIISSALYSTGVLADTLELMGPNASSWGIGWMVGAEAWAGAAWCGDTLNRDSGTVLECIESDFEPDTGGLDAGVTYINWNYKFRNYYAQLPIVWTNWAGFDATGYRNFMIVYKGLLPVHQMKVSFFYGNSTDSTKNKNNLGDGVGTLAASPNEWKTAVLPIPDSVDMEGITGAALAIGNAPNKGGKTSDVGNLKVAKVALVSGGVKALPGPERGKIAAMNGFSFTPSSGGVTLTAYSLRGEVLMSKMASVQSGKQYPVRRFVMDHCGAKAARARLISIKGPGVGVINWMW